MFSLPVKQLSSQPHYGAKFGDISSQHVDDEEGRRHRGNGHQQGLGKVSQDVALPVLPRGMH